MIEPRFAWHPPRERSLGADCVAFWEAAGQTAFDWQALVVDGMLGVGVADQFVSTEDGLNVARQNGKGVVLQMIELYFAFVLGYRLVMHTAHEFATAEDHHLRLEAVIQNCPDLHRQVKDKGGYKHANGQESINLKSGCKILFKARTKGGARGFSGDLLVWDEAMIIPDTVYSSQKYTIRASKAPHGQKTIYAGSAVDRQIHEYGVNFTRLRQRGLAEDSRTSYFEWSAPFDHPDEVTRDTLADMGHARAANPSMDDGLISEETVRDELRGAPLRSLAVEIYGIGDYPPVDASTTGLFDLKRWSALAGDASLEEPTLALDVSPLRTSATIGAAKRVGGKVHIGVLDRQDGTGWIVPRLAELVEEHRARVVCDERGPAASLLPELEEAGVEVEVLDTTAYTRACGMFFDAFEQGTLEHDGSVALEAAIRGAAQRPLGDAWAWSRKNSRADITPLVAVTIAHWAEATMKPEKKLVAVSFA